MSSWDELPEISFNLHAGNVCPVTIILHESLKQPVNLFALLIIFVFYGQSNLKFFRKVTAMKTLNIPGVLHPCLHFGLQSYKFYGHL